MSGPARVAGAIQRAIRRTRTPRVVWRGAGRLHIAVGGPGQGKGTAFPRAVERELNRHPAVSWAAINAPLGVVVVACRGAVREAELIAIVERAERDHRQEPEPHAGGPSHSLASGLRRRPCPGVFDRVPGAAAALAASVAGLSFAAAGRALRAARLPAELGSLVQFVDTQPSLRGLVERAAGPDRADLVLATASALTQSAAHGVSGLAIDIAQRVMQLAEAVSQRDAWARSEAALCGDRHRCAASLATIDRPCPLPLGPVERYSERIGIAAIGAFGGVLAASSSPRRAAGVALAGLPKASRLGREGFAAMLGCLLTRRGVVIMDHRVLRILDRIDAIVVDSEVLATGRLVVADVVPTAGGSGGSSPRASTGDHHHIAELTGAVHALFDPDRVSEASADGAFALGPLDALGPPGHTGTLLAAELHRNGAQQVLGLTRDSMLQALVALAPQATRAANLLVAAARNAETPFLLADQDCGAQAAAARGAEGEPGPDCRDRDEHAHLPGPALVLPGGGRLTAAIRGLQAQGAVVLLVSRNRRALAAADCGIGVAGPGGQPAWGAQLMVGDDLAAAALVVDAVRAARAVSRRSVALSQAGTALGAALAFGGEPQGTAGRSLLAVNGAAAIAMTTGAWTAAQLARQPAVVPAAPRVPWHAMPAEAVLDRIRSKPGGLDGNEAHRRWLPDDRQPPRTSLPRAVLADLANPLTPILAGGALLSASIGAVTDSVIIAGVSALSALMGGIQRTRTDRSMARLFEASAVKARVLRDGTEHTVPAVGLVRGDIVLLGAGDVVPADCRLLDATALQVDESSLTGESHPSDKTTEPVTASAIADRRSLVYEGTTVAAGRAKAVVVAVGSATEMGQSLAALPGSAPVTGVEARLAQITSVTLPLALGSAGAVVAAGLVRARPVRDSIGAAVGLAVASVPEGLPFLVTAAQLAAARRLARRGALVRNPRTIEALGRVNVLCFDKTGTLTMGQMAVSAVSDGTASRRIGALGHEHGKVLAAALRATPQADGGTKVEHMTDEAVLHGAAAAGVDRSDEHPLWRLIDAQPFEPSRGYHAALADTTNGPILSVKGAPEQILPRCTRWRGRSLGEGERRRLNAEFDRLAKSGYRVLAVAENPVTARYQLADELSELSFAGYLALGDQVRTAAGASVRDLRDAGVHIVMITGDHPATAAVIARELDVLNGDTIITGTDLDMLDDADLPAALAGASVIARCTPAQKVRVVQAFQAGGRVVAMTGDGANDAAAIRLADVGIALGRRGTPAARAAADLVVSDDRLETILAAIVEGRAMWRSVRQAIGILVGGNIGEIGYTLLGSLLTGTSPLSARQLLLVNLLTDLAPALAIALRRPPEDASADLLAEGPDASLGSALTEEIAVRAVATGAAASGAWLAARLTGRAARARTVGLAAVVGAELGQTLLVGGRSPAVAIASLVSTGLLVGIVQTPGISQFFGCTPIGPVGWSIAAGGSLAATAGSLLLPRLGSSLMPAVRSLAGSAAADAARALLADLRARPCGTTPAPSPGAGPVAAGRSGLALMAPRPATAPPLDGMADGRRPSRRG